ncbi:MAG: yhjX 1 [Actinomycetia bacterium]|nr:yhjX 1 [Actinomycetes bacterium]
MVVVARRSRVHPAWVAAGVAFVALLCAAGFRAAPGVLMVPLQEEFGWSRGLVSLAVGVNLVLFGLTAPFAAALMERFGVRAVTSVALALIAAGSGLSVVVTSSWQLVLLWGVLIGLGTGSMALVFAAIVANRWFVRRRGLVMGILTSATATGQLIFLPVLAWMTEQSGWRAASLVVAAAALAVIPLVVLRLRDSPADLGVAPYGAPVTHADPPVDNPANSLRPSATLPVRGPTSGVAGAHDAATAGPSMRGTAGPSMRGTGGAAGPARRAITTLVDAARTRTFWALAIGFAICGASTNGLIATHFIPSAHDHGMAETTAAGLLAVVGVFDIVGTVASGWLTDKVNPRLLLAAYYTLRGAGLVMLPGLLSDSLHPSIIAFVVVYGLDWVATVPPTAALCREAFGEAGQVVFGWVFAAHQIGAAVVSVGAGVVRDLTGQYTLAWIGAACLCLVAAFASTRVGRPAGRPLSP